MRTKTDHDAINRMLASHGLGQLEDGAGLLAQLGYLVQDHDHLRSLLIRCEPENRSAMYDSLKAGLRFEPRSLDSYIAESARLAEARQLPTIDAEGNLTWPKPDPSAADVESARQSTGELFAAQNAVEVTFAKWALEVTCRKCTRAATFSGARKADAIQAARDAGWVYYEVDGQAREICPECPVAKTAGEPQRPERAAIERGKEFALVNEFREQPIGVIARYMETPASATKEAFDAAALLAAKRWEDDGKPKPLLN